jgi:hypothetical protein
MNFLKSDVENKDRITMAIQGFSLGSNFKSAKSKLKKNNQPILEKCVVPKRAGVVNFMPNKTA